jgi:hypothetical protein
MAMEADPDLGPVYLRGFFMVFSRFPLKSATFGGDHKGKEGLPRVIWSFLEFFRRFLKSIKMRRFGGFVQ